MERRTDEQKMKLFLENDNIYEKINERISTKKTQNFKHWNQEIIKK